MQYQPFVNTLRAQFSKSQLTTDDGVVWAADTAVELQPFWEQHTDAPGDDQWREEGGWHQLQEAYEAEYLVAFEYLSTPAGGAVTLDLLRTEEGGFVVVDADSMPIEVVAFIEADEPKDLLDALVPDLLSDNGAAYGTEVLGALSDVVRNHQPGYLSRAAVREACWRFLEWSEEQGRDGWMYVGPDRTEPQTEEAKREALDQYMERRYEE